MAKPAINFRELAFLIADANAYSSTICRNVLRGFGTNRAIETRNENDAITALEESKIDLLLCDANLPPSSGFALVERIRKDPNCAFRTIPIIILMSDTTPARIAQARDCGANVVIARPFSPATLQSHVTWVTLSPRAFVDTPKYFGPDRRLRNEGYPDGQGRRAGDAQVMVGDATGPAMAQSDIDKLFSR